MNILIIGATYGIGYQLWRYYALSGDNVAITSRRKEILEQQIKENPDNTVAIQCEIADLFSFDSMLKDVMSKFDFMIVRNYT